MATNLQGLLRRHTPLAWVFAGAVFAAGLAARLILLPHESRLTFATLYPGVVVVFYLAGLGPGLLYVGLSAVSGLFVPQREGWSLVSDGQTAISQAGFLLSSLFIAYVVLRMKRAGRRLEEARAHLQDLYDKAPCAYCLIDASGRILEMNDTGVEWLDCPRDEVMSADFRRFLDRESQVRFDAHMPILKRIGRTGPTEYELLDCSGKSRRISLVASAVRDSQARFVHARCVMFDVSDMARVRQQMQRVNREQAVMLNNDLVGIVKLQERRILWKNRAVDQMFGFERGELLGRSMRELYFDDTSFADVGKRAYEKLSQGERFRETIRMRCKNGSAIWVDVSGGMLAPDSDESLWMLIDVTAMHRYQEQIERMASHDALTGLPNRRLFIDRLSQAIAAARRHGEQLAVCFVDLDGFKAVNDEHGHAAGDRLLCVITSRMAGTVRTADTLARMGGDEFALVLTQVSGSNECQASLQRLLEHINEPVDLGNGIAVAVGASIGVALLPRDGCSDEALIRNADAAMYRAKRAGRNRICFFARESEVSGPGQERPQERHLPARSEDRPPQT